MVQVAYRLHLHHSATLLYLYRTLFYLLRTRPLLLPLVLSMILLVFLGVISRRDLEGGVNQQVVVDFLMADSQLQILVNFIESLGVNPLHEISVFLGPVLKDGLKSRTNSRGFLEKLFALFIEEVFETIGNKDEVEDEIFIDRLVAGDADDVSDQFRVLRYEPIFDVPVGLLDEVGEEDGLDLIHQEDLGDCFEDFVDGEAEGDVAAVGHGAQDGRNCLDLVAGVGAEGPTVLGREGKGLVFVALHCFAIELDNQCKGPDYIVQFQMQKNYHFIGVQTIRSHIIPGIKQNGSQEPTQDI